MNQAPSGPVDLGIAGISDAVEIGAGGFGVVYRAVEADLGRTVAVKVLSGNLDEAAQYRFERERRAMGRLSGHPNIVTIYRGGYTSLGYAYLVMEYLDRGSLADRLAQVGALGWEETLKFGVQLSGALETSHRAGVLHRDIKPGNILLSSLGNAKLCDFGIARLQGAPETKSSVVTASLSHAPPDIVNGSRPDARSDVYSLASTMFELVAATPPFVRPTDESMVPILARIAQDPVPSLPETQLPGPMFEVIEQAMAKDPGERPATAAELGTLLVAAQQRLGLPPTPIPIEAIGADDPDGGGYIPFPDSPSGPLPAPTARSPHRTGSPATSGPTGAGATGDAASISGQTAPPTVVTPSGFESTPNPSPTPTPPTADAASVSAQTVVSGQHDPATWAPPQVSGDVPPAGGGPSGSGPGSGFDSIERPGWLVPAAGAVALLLVIVVGFALLRGGDDEPTDAGDTTVAPTDTTLTDTTTSDDTVDPDAPSTSVGQNDTDYPFYETISDETGTITVDVPTEWTDRRTALGTNGAPQVAVATKIDDGFVGTYDEPGIQIAVVEGDPEPDQLDLLLDQFVDPGCTMDSRRNIGFPFPGRVDRFSACGGGTTELVHIAYSDEESGLIVLVRVQVLSDQDAVAVDTMRSSLILEDNVPE